MRYIKATLIAAAVLSVTACQSTSEPILIAGETNKAVSPTQNTLAVYEKAKVDFGHWQATMKKTKALEIYSKDSVNDLKDAWSDALRVYNEFADDPAKATEDYSSFSSGSYADKFDVLLWEVNRQYKNLLTLKSNADELLAESIAQMDYLKGIEAPEYFARDFRALEKDYRRLFSYVEDNDIEDVQTEQALFLRKAKTMEIRVVRVINLRDQEKDLKSLRAGGYHKLASISFTRAKASLEAAIAVISATPRDAKAIDKAVAKVDFELGHLTHIGQEVKHFQKVDSGRYEVLILNYEKRLLAIEQAVDGSDLRNISMQEQGEAIVERVAKLRALESDNAKIGELETRLATLTQEVESKTSENTALLERVSELDSQNSHNLDVISNLQLVVDSYKRADGYSQPLEINVNTGSAPSTMVAPAQAAPISVTPETDVKGVVEGG